MRQEHPHRPDTLGRPEEEPLRHEYRHRGSNGRGGTQRSGEQKCQHHDQRGLLPSNG